MHAHARTAVAAALVAGLTACDRTPTAPSTASPSVAAPQPQLMRLVIVAPSRLAPGATAPVTLRGEYSDQTVRDLPVGGLISAGPEDVLVPSEGGITAVQVGEGEVAASYQGLSSKHAVVVIPDGTFRVRGRVVEAGAAGWPVGGVRVDAEGGPSGLTNLEGEYLLWGVPDRARLRFSRPGYAPHEIALTLSSDHIENVVLELAGPRVDFAGPYQLTVDAAAECRDALPAELRTRRFTAVVTQVDTMLRIRLGDAQFAGPSGSATIEGLVRPSGREVVLTLGSASLCSGPDSRIVEAVGTNYLVIGGRAVLSVSGTGLSGPLEGYMTYQDAPECPQASTIRECLSRSHRVTLTR